MVLINQFRRVRLQRLQKRQDGLVHNAVNPVIKAISALTVVLQSHNLLRLGSALPAIRKAIREISVQTVAIQRYRKKMSRNLRMNKFILLSLLFFSTIVNAQVSKMLGYWDTVDDRTGDRRGRVYVYKATDGKYYGKIVSLYQKNADGSYSILDNVPQEWRHVIGMVIIKELEPDGDNVMKGRCYDPESQKTYYGKITYKPDKDQLILRGSIDKLGVLGRSQTWLRTKTQ